MDPLASPSLAWFSSFALIGLAEFGDKSQLVCMALAARYRPWPVLLGAVAAFALLNLLAVLFGATVAHWLPEWVVVVTVSLLFLGFGIHALRQGDEEPEETVESDGASHGIFFSTFALITVAEFGDKTQITAAGLGSTVDPLAVWFGATLALALTSAFGVWLGRKLLDRMPVGLIHRLAGGLFVLFALVTLGAYFVW